MSLCEQLWLGGRYLECCYELSIDFDRDFFVGIRKRFHWFFGITLSQNFRTSGRNSVTGITVMIRSCRFCDANGK